MGVDHPFPEGLHGKLGVCVGECFHWALLTDFPRVDIWEPLFNSIEEDGFN